MGVRLIPFPTLRFPGQEQVRRQNLLPQLNWSEALWPALALPSSKSRIEAGAPRQVASFFPLRAGTTSPSPVWT